MTTLSGKNWYAPQHLTIGKAKMLTEKEKQKILDELVDITQLLIDTEEGYTTFHIAKRLLKVTDRLI